MNDGIEWRWGGREVGGSAYRCHPLWRIEDSARAVTTPDRLIAHRCPVSSFHTQPVSPFVGRVHLAYAITLETRRLGGF